MAQKEAHVAPEELLVLRKEALSVAESMLGRLSTACKSTLYLMMHEVGNIASFDSSTDYVRLKQSADHYSNMLKYLYEKAPRVYDAFCTLDMRQDSELSKQINSTMKRLLISRGVTHLPKMLMSLSLERKKRSSKRRDLLYDTSEVDALYHILSKRDFALNEVATLLVVYDSIVSSEIPVASGHHSDNVAILSSLSSYLLTRAVLDTMG